MTSLCNLLDAYVVLVQFSMIILVTIGAMYFAFGPQVYLADPDRAPGPGGIPTTLGIAIPRNTPTTLPCPLSTRKVRTDLMGVLISAWENCMWEAF